MSATEEAARQLIVAIEELVRFAKTCSSHAPADIERFDELDGSVYGLANAVGLPIPVGNADPNGSYGHTRILTWASPRGRYIVPTDDWLGRMRQLRSAAEAIARHEHQPRAQAELSSSTSSSVANGKWDHICTFAAKKMSENPSLKHSEILADYRKRHWRREQPTLKQFRQAMSYRRKRSATSPRARSKSKSKLRRK